MSESRANAAAAVAGAAFALAWWIGPPVVWTLVGAIAAGHAVTGRTSADVGRGFACGVIAYAGALSWLPAALGRYGVPPIAWAGLVILQAIVPALAFGWASLGAARGTPLPIAAGLAWIAAGTVAAVTQPLPAGPELALAESPALLGPAALGGTALLAGVLFAWGALAARAPAEAAAWAAVWAASFVVTLPAADPTAGAATGIGVVQPALGAMEGRRPSTAGGRADRVRSLAGRAAQAGADWVATPEGAWPWDPGHPGSAARRHLAQAWGLNTPIVLGATPFDPPANAVVVVRSGSISDRFDKQRLVPLAERSIAGFGHDTFAPGRGPRRLHVGVEVTPLICYEDLLPGPLREATGVVLLAVAQDAWLGPTGARQHLASARLAAVSTGRWLVRAAGSGWSAVVDASGRLVWSMPYEDADVEPSGGRFAVTRVPLRSPWFTGARAAPLLSALAAALLLVRGRPR